MPEKLRADNHEGATVCEEPVSKTITPICWADIKREFQLALVWLASPDVLNDNDIDAFKVSLIYPNLVHSTVPARFSLGAILKPHGDLALSNLLNQYIEI